MKDDELKLMADRVISKFKETGKHENAKLLEYAESLYFDIINRLPKK